MKIGMHLFVAVVAAAPLAGNAHAEAGSVSHLSGTLSVKKADGSVRILSQKSEIASGDTLNTERDTYAQIKFADGGQITLKPNTAIRIENFKFSEQKRQEDSFVFSLLKGGMRAVTGLIGKIDPDNYLMNIATGTIGIRGTTYSADDCLSSECIAPEAGNAIAPAVYVSVADGEIVVRNAQGAQAYRAGQFGQISKGERPLFLSTDPGLQFTPPATFFQAVGFLSKDGGSPRECVVGGRGR
jgi:hypothetical protein